MMQGSRKKYMYTFILGHRIWKSSFVWRDCITYTVNSKLDAATERKKKRDMAEAEEGGTFSTKKFSVFSKAIKNLVKSKEEKQEEELKEYSNMVYFELSTFIKFFTNF